MRAFSAKAAGGSKRRFSLRWDVMASIMVGVPRETGRLPEAVADAHRWPDVHERPAVEDLPAEHVRRRLELGLEREIDEDVIEIDLEAAFDVGEGINAAAVYERTRGLVGLCRAGRPRVARG